MPDCDFGGMQNRGGGKEKKTSRSDGEKHHSGKAKAGFRDVTRPPNQRLCSHGGVALRASGVQENIPQLGGQVAPGRRTSVAMLSPGQQNTDAQIQIPRCTISAHATRKTHSDKHAQENKISTAKPPPPHIYALTHRSAAVQLSVGHNNFQLLSLAVRSHSSSTTPRKAGGQAWRRLKRLRENKGPSEQAEMDGWGLTGMRVTQRAKRRQIVLRVGTLCVLVDSAGVKNADSEACVCVWEAGSERRVDALPVSLNATRRQLFCSK